MTRAACAITATIGGIGAALAGHAGHEGCAPILHARSAVQLQEPINQLSRNVPDIAIEPVVGDLSTSACARTLPAAFAERAPELDLLFNNAGVLLDGIKMPPDGMEMHTQVNLIAPYVLMQTLKSNVAQAGGVIVNASSGSALRAKSLSVDALRRPAISRKLIGSYASSKLVLSVVTRALGPAYFAIGIALVSVNPGTNRTEMTASDGIRAILRVLNPLFNSSSEKDAARVFDVSRVAKAGPCHGAFFSGGRPKRLLPFTESEEIEKSLLEFCRIQAES